MASTWIISFLNWLAQQLAIYLGTFMLATGLLGGILSIIVFFSLRTFQESSCAFYLNIMAFFNIVNLLFGLLSRIIITGFNIDWTISSRFYCAFRWFCLYCTTLTSFTMVCLATIDQYIATGSHPSWRRWNNIKWARRLTVVFILFWSILALPYMFYFTVIVQPISNRLICTSVNIDFFRYHTYVYIITLAGVLPVTITVVFGLLAYRNVRQLPHRTVPLVRRELDKQLTTMVLAQVVHNIFATIPYTIVIALIYSVPFPNDPVLAAQMQFALLITIYLYYLNYASPFYIYLCASERFRHQLFYVLFEIHLKRWRRRRVTIDQIDAQF